MSFTSTTTGNKLDTSPKSCHVFVKIGVQLRSDVTAENGPDHASYNDSKLLSAVSPFQRKTPEGLQRLPQYTLIHVFPQVGERELPFPNSIDLGHLLCGAKTLVRAHCDPASGKLNDAIVITRSNQDNLPTKMTAIQRNLFQMVAFGLKTQKEVLDRLSNELGFKYKYVRFN